MPQASLLESARSAARSLCADLGWADDPPELGNHRYDDSAAGHPQLHLEDVSEIPFVSVIRGVEQYQHRARVRAGSGDLFAAVVPVAAGYEDYCKHTLQLGEPEFLEVAPTAGPMAVAEACRHGATIDRLVEVAGQAGGLVIHPYMSIGSTWALASELAARSDADIRVLGPTPRALWAANDKSRLTALVRRIVGARHAIETRSARSPVELAVLLRDFANAHDRVGLKRTRCASAMGNIVFRSSDVMTWDRSQANAEVEAFLGHTEWDGDEEVLVMPWLNTDLSPSTQLWIPATGHGDPFVEGIYEQLLVGEEKVFLGSRPSRLPDAVELELTEISVRVAAGLQALGYVGRCSFDFLVTGDPSGSFETLFTECNGRWGGTSTPMRLLDRLFPKQRPPYRAQDYVHESLVGVPFSEVLARVGELAFDATTRTGRFVFYNVGPLEKSGKLDVVSIGESFEEVEHGLSHVLPRALGIDPN